MSFFIAIVNLTAVHEVLYNVLSVNAILLALHGRSFTVGEMVMGCPYLWQIFQEAVDSVGLLGQINKVYLQ